MEIQMTLQKAYKMADTRPSKSEIDSLTVGIIQMYVLPTYRGLCFCSRIHGQVGSEPHVSENIDRDRSVAHSRSIITMIVIGSELSLRVPQIQLWVTSAGYTERRF